jgi:hypothetical protein
LHAISEQSLLCSSLLLPPVLIHQQCSRHVSAASRTIVWLVLDLLLLLLLLVLLLFVLCWLH